MMMLSTIKREVIELLKSIIGSPNADTMPVTVRTLIQKQLGLIESSNRLPAIYTHLTPIMNAKHLSDEVKSLLEPVMAEMDICMKERLYTRDAFDNQPDVAEFESLLAYAILRDADVSLLKVINQKIIDYLEQCKAKEVDLDFHISIALKGFHLPFDEGKRPIDALIALLARDPEGLSEKERIQILIETFTLHLLMFNYQHIYDPAHFKPDVYVKKSLKEKREALHRMIRPEKEGELFHPDIRGRISVTSSKRVKDFGICDETRTPHALKDIHRYDFTPHKYREIGVLTSPLVCHCRAEHIPYIAGPSGTAADCIEGLSLLFPMMTRAEYQSYMMLMAAAEVGMGHHSMCEVMLPAIQAGVLSPIKGRDISKPTWAQVDRHEIYMNMLTDTFKEMEGYKVFLSQYPDMFEANPLARIEKSSVVPVRKAALTWLGEHHQRAAGRTFYGSRFWRQVEWQDVGMTLPKDFADPVRLRSNANLCLLESDLDVLTEQEKRFIKLVKSQNIVLTHYTPASEAIIKSGMIFSNDALVKKELKFRDASKSDIDYLGNSDYVFFRFEFKHTYGASSRFGDIQVILDGRKGQFLKQGWISLFDMYKPHSASVVKELYYQDQEVRRCFWSPFETRVIFDYPLSHEKHDIDVADLAFQGQDIMQGLALAMVRELRRIGGKMQEEMLDLASSLKLDEAHYDDSIKQLNWLLSRLFRVEAKIPRRVKLSEESVHVFHNDNVGFAIIANEIPSLRYEMKDLTLETVLDTFVGQDGAVIVEMRLIEAAFLLAKADIVEWLMREGCQLSEYFIRFALEKDSPFIANVTLEDFIRFRKLIPALMPSTHSLTGFPVLHHAALCNSLELVFYLLKEGAEPSEKDKLGKTFDEYISLDHLAKYADPEELEQAMVLLPSLDVINRQDDKGNTLLHYACMAARVDMIRFLVSNGASLSIENNGFLNPVKMIESALFEPYKAITEAELKDLLVLIPDLKIEEASRWVDSRFRDALKARKLDLYVQLLEAGRIIVAPAILQEIVRDAFRITNHPQGMISNWDRLKPFVDSAFLNAGPNPLILFMARQGRDYLLRLMLADPFFDKGVRDASGDNYIEALYQRCALLLKGTIDDALALYKLYPEMSDARSKYKDTFHALLLEKIISYPHYSRLPDLKEAGLLFIEDEQGRTLLHHAIETTDFHLLSQLLSYKDEIDSFIEKYQASLEKVFIQQLLRLARSGKKEAFNELLAFGAEHFFTAETVVPPYIYYYLIEEGELDLLLMLLGFSSQISLTKPYSYEHSVIDSVLTGFENISVEEESKIFRVMPGVDRKQYSMMFYEMTRRVMVEPSKKPVLRDLIKTQRDIKHNIKLLNLYKKIIKGTHPPFNHWVKTRENFARKIIISFYLMTPDAEQESLFCRAFDMTPEQIESIAKDYLKRLEAPAATGDDADGVLDATNAAQFDDDEEDRVAKEVMQGRQF